MKWPLGAIVSSYALIYVDSNSDVCNKTDSSDVCGAGWSIPHDLWEKGDQRRKEKLSLPLTLAYALQHYFPGAQQSLEKLTVYIIGAVENIEGLADWNVLWNARPSQLEELSLVFIIADKIPCPREGCNLCPRAGSRRYAKGIVAHCLFGYFPRVLQGWKFEAPDLAFISAPGIPRLDRSTWAPAIEWLFLRDVPTIWSHFGWEGDTNDLDAMPRDWILSVHPSDPGFQNPDYEGECEEVLFTKITLERYAAAFGFNNESHRLSLKRNLFPVFAPGFDPFNSVFSHNFNPEKAAEWRMTRNAKLFLTGKRYKQHVPGTAIDVASVYFDAAEVVAKLLINHVGGHMAVENVVGKIERTGWLQNTCKQFNKLTWRKVGKDFYAVARVLC